MIVFKVIVEVSFLITIRGYNGKERHRTVEDLHVLAQNNRQERNLDTAMRVVPDVIRQQKEEHPCITFWTIDVDPSDTWPT